MLQIGPWHVHLEERAPEADTVINTMCEYYNVSRDELYRSRSGQLSEPGNVAIFLTRKLRHDSQNKIGSRFQMKKYSSVSSVIERMKKQMLTDQNLGKHVDMAAGRVRKSQEQT